MKKSEPPRKMFLAVDLLNLAVITVLPKLKNFLILERKNPVFLDLRQKTGLIPTKRYSLTTYFGSSFFMEVGTSIPQSPCSYQSSPSSSIGCCVRSEPLPHLKSSTAQYWSHPQQMRSGCLGCNGIFFAIAPIHSTQKTNGLRHSSTLICHAL